MSHAPMPAIDIRITECNPSYFSPGGYEDPETGEWVQTMTDEEIADYHARAEGMRLFRISVQCNGKSFGVETKWIGVDDDPSEALREGTNRLWDSFSSNRPDTTPPPKR